MEWSILISYTYEYHIDNIYTHTHNSRIESSWIIAEGGWKFYIYEFESNEKQYKGGIRERKGRGNYIGFLTIGSLTFFDMNRCCHEQWNIESADMV